MDVSGWWSPGSNRFTPIDPIRAYDTRELPEPVMLPAGAIRAIDVGGEFVPDDAVAVAVNVAAVNPEDRGFMTVFPCGVEPPLASNLNFKTGERRAVAAIVELGAAGEAAGKICVTVSAATHFIVDVTGYDAPSSPWSPDVTLATLPDTRVVDTREPSLPGTRFDGETFQRFDLSDAIPSPDETVAAVLNVVAVRADRESFATVYPCQSPRPTTSSLNYDLDQTANLVVTALSDDGEICIFTNSPVDIVVDLVGVFAGPEGSLVNQLSLTDDTDEFLVPDQQFEIDGPDYTIRCDADVEVRLRLGVAPRVTARSTASWSSVTRSSRTSSSSIAPDEAITVELERGAAENAYSFRCLPTDFPPFTVTRSGENAPGWYLTELGWGGPGIDGLHRDPRRARRPGLVQADRPPADRPEVTVERTPGCISGQRRSVSASTASPVTGSWTSTGTSSMSTSPIRSTSRWTITTTSRSPELRRARGERSSATR